MPAHACIISCQLSQLHNTSEDATESKTFSDDGMHAERHLADYLCPDLFTICHCCIQCARCVHQDTWQVSCLPTGS